VEHDVKRGNPARGGIIGDDQVLVHASGDQVCGFSSR
jgi:hypothetical protein